MNEKKSGKCMVTTINKTVGETNEIIEWVQRGIADNREFIKKIKGKPIPEKVLEMVQSELKVRLGLIDISCELFGKNNPAVLKELRKTKSEGAKILNELTELKKLKKERR
jgi:hypothetical protein